MSLELNGQQGSEIYSLSSLKKNNLVPVDVKRLSDTGIANRCIRLSEFEKLSLEQKLGVSKIVIADDAVWAGLGNSVSVSSNGKDSLWITARDNSMITKNVVDLDSTGDKLTLLPIHPISLIRKAQLEQKTVKFKEEKTMAVDYGKLIDDIEIEGQGAPVPANSFAGDSDKAAKDREKIANNKTLLDAISTNTQGVDIAECHALRAFNRRVGSLIGYITSTDAKVIASAPLKPVLVDGNVQLDPAVTDEAIKNAFNQGKRVPVSKLKRVPTLTFKESAPSTMLGAIIAIPQGGLVPMDVITNGEGKKVEFDANDQSLVYLAKTKDEIAILALEYFGGMLRENEITHGELAGDITITAEAAFSKKKGPIARIVFKPSKRKRVIIGTNYVPRKTFATMALSEIRNANAQEQSHMNKSVFGPIFKVVDNGSKYENLDAASKALIGKDGDVYTSEFFKAGGQAPIVTRFFDNDQTIADPQFPRKEFVSKDGKKETAKNITFDVLNPKEELASISPETSKKFAAMREAMGTLTVKEAVKSVIRKAPKANPKAQRLTLSANESLALLLNASSKGTDTLNLETGLDKNGISKLQEDIASLAKFI
ncbi:hypothetical protein [Clostridium paraputrificum]|uniref:Uncharacterized protein n=1 Tax=Clostridium paraputrificum TaxID=29363 RepID=A0A6N3EZ57_9CLOT